MHSTNILPPDPVSYRANLLKKLSYILSLSRYIAKTENVSVIKQLWEISFLYITKQLGPFLYYEAQLWKKQFSLTQKAGFYNTKQYKKRINELNDPVYRKFSNHKLAEKSILSLMGIPTAEFIGYLHPFNGNSKFGKELASAAQLKELLVNYIGQKVCFKLAEGWGGTGFMAVTLTGENEELYLSLLPDVEIRMDVLSFFNEYLAENYHFGYVIEHYIEQHEVFANFNETSVNTIRMWLIQKEDKVKFIGAVLRIGREGQVIDNSLQGGVIALIDEKTGKIKKGRTTSVIPEYFDNHPDTGAKITGVQLPYWFECIELGKASLRVFPHTNFVGLDIACAKSGPVIVELNQEPDKVSARIFEKPHSELLDNKF